MAGRSREAADGCSMRDDWCIARPCMYQITFVPTIEVRSRRPLYVRLCIPAAWLPCVIRWLIGWLINCRYVTFIFFHVPSVCCCWEAARCPWCLNFFCAWTLRVFLYVRTGRWHSYETMYAQRIVGDFEAGTMPLSEGTKLGSFLCNILNCSPS